jgi:hypothetical protein
MRDSCRPKRRKIMAQKKIQVCFLEIACVGGYMASGQWKSVISDLLESPCSSYDQTP